MAETIVIRNKQTGKAAILKYATTGTSVVGLLRFPSGDEYTIKVPLEPIFKMAIGKLDNKVGWSWSSIKKSATKLAKKVGNRKLLLKVKKIMEDPRFAKGASLAGAIFPPFGITYDMTRRAAVLIEKASTGDLDAQASIAAIKAKAIAGDLASAKVSRAMATMYAAKKYRGIDVAGWAYELGRVKKRGNFLSDTYRNAIEVSAK